MLKKLLIFLTFIVSCLILVPSAFASTLYLSPGSINIPSGSSVSVSVNLNTSGESINGVSAYLNYPSDKLEVAWISYGGSFPIAAEGTYGGGNIRISRGSISGVVGNINVATIGFIGKTQGSATVSFIGGSAAPRTSDSSDSLNMGGSSGGVYTVGPPQPQSTITPTDTTKPVISKVLVSEISTNSATITWMTDKKADSTLEYGLAPNKYFLSGFDKNLVTDHTLKLEGPLLTPGATFHFRIKSKDEAGNEGIGNDEILQLTGYTVTIKVIDTRNKAVIDAEVLLYTANPLRSRTSPTGKATFSNVTAGKHLVVVKLKNNSEKTGEITVADNILFQNFSLVVDATTSKTSPLLYYAIVLTALVVGAAVVYGIYKKIKRTSQSSSVTPPIGG